ncbi:MAG: hypothetical protein HN922_06605 [Anaerolineae bacterium]|nr:hypothetical protein [Anaerolineae bacterium]
MRKSKKDLRKPLMWRKGFAIHRMRKNILSWDAQILNNYVPNGNMTP